MDSVSSSAAVIDHLVRTGLIKGTLCVKHLDLPQVLAEDPLLRKALCAADVKIVNYRSSHEKVLSGMGMVRKTPTYRKGIGTSDGRLILGRLEQRRTERFDGVFLTLSGQPSYGLGYGISFARS